MLKMLFSLAATTAFSLSLIAAPKAASTEKTLKASGNIEWTGTGIGKAHTGMLSLKTGEVIMNKNEVTGGQFVFDMNTISYKNEKLVGHLKSADFFEVTKYPEAKFVIKSVKALPKAAAGSPTHEITGDLTIKDKTNSVTFPAIVTETAGTWAAKGTVVLADRTKYGITYNSKQFFDIAKLGDKLIEDQISIALNLSAK